MVHRAPGPGRVLHLLGVTLLTAVLIALTLLAVVVSAMGLLAALMR